MTFKFNEIIKIGDLNIYPCYAGHVLGAVMFRITYKGISVMYTGDFNTVADRHLNSCHYDYEGEVDILISECTYGLINREWRKKREITFIEYAKKTLERGGKLILPVFALGRAQEIFTLIEEVWDKCAWKYPVYFTSSIIE